MTTPLGPWLAPAGAASGVVAGIAQGIANAGDLAGELQAPLIQVVHAGAWVSDPRNWVRVAFVITGGVLVILGLGTTIIGGKATAGHVKRLAVTAGKVAAA